MRDIPFFTTENGVAGLSLKEIPYRRTAYITVRSASDAAALLEECIGFCKAAGAEKILACGHSCLDKYPFETAVWQLQADSKAVGTTDDCLFPVQENTVNKWREYYNERMAQVPNAAYLTLSDAQQMARKGQAYFVHRDAAFLGIGAVSGNKVLNVISLQPAAGKDVLRALVSTVSEDRVILEVASTNEKALRLYEACGFVRTKEISRWYRLL